MPLIPCPPPSPIVRGIVVFDVPTFTAAYPEFSGVPSGQLNNAFLLATLILNNTCMSVIQDGNKRDTLLQLLTAHITFLTYGSNDGAGNVTPAPGIIGHIDTAAEGAVSVGATFGGNGGPTQDWYTSSKYGALYWVSTASYRTMRYVGAPCAPLGYGWPVGGWGGGNCGC